MLFRKKNCTQCGSSYDVVDDTCPTCHARDENYESLGVPKNIIWLPIYKQILLFVIGFLGLELVGTILSIGLMSIRDDTVLYLMLVNSIRYAVVAAGMGLLLIGEYKRFKKGFINWWPYLIGVGGVIALTTFSIFYNTIVNIIYPTTPNANQGAVNALVGTYPLISILVLGILGPVVEEMTYRVGLFSFLMRTKRWLAYLIVIPFFALIHFDFTSILTGFTENDWSPLINELLNLPSYAFAGGVLCVLYDTCGLSASIVAHVGNNLYSIIMFLIASKLGV